VYRCRFGRVPGKLHRRNQPAFEPQASDQPTIRKSAGSTCHITLLPARRRLLVFHFLPPFRLRRRLRHRAALCRPYAPPSAARVPPAHLPRRCRLPPARNCTAVRTRTTAPAPVRHRAAVTATAPPTRHRAAVTAIHAVARTLCTSTVPPPTHLAAHSRIHAAHAKCSVFCPNLFARRSSQRRILVALCDRDGS
jgi:hypothetical protein